MSLIQWNRHQFLPEFSNVLNNFLDDDWLGKGSQMPAVNIKDNLNEYQIEVAAPGFTKEDFKVALNHNVLTVSSEKKTENVEDSKEKGKYTRREFSYQSFSRSFTLPKGVEQGNISANYENGILNITVPKQEASKEKGIKTINVS